MCPLRLPVHPAEVSPGLAVVPAGLCQRCQEHPGQGGNTEGTGRAGSGCCVCPLQHRRCSAEPEACFSCRDISTGDSAVTTCPKTRILPCLLVSTGGPGTRRYWAMGMEKGCSSSLPHGAALPRTVALLGPRALGTAHPTLALQDVPGVPAAAPALCPMAACGRSMSGGIRAVSRKRANSEPEARGGSAQLSPVPLLWQHKQTPRDQLSRLCAGSSQNLLFSSQIWQR